MMRKIERRDDAKMLRAQRLGPVDEADRIVEGVMRPADFCRRRIDLEFALVEAQVMAVVGPQHHAVARQSDRVAVGVFGLVYDGDAGHVCSSSRFCRRGQIIVRGPNLSYKSLFREAIRVRLEETSADELSRQSREEKGWRIAAPAPWRVDGRIDFRRRAAWSCAQPLRRTIGGRRRAGRAHRRPAGDAERRDAHAAVEFDRDGAWPRTAGALVAVPAELSCALQLRL